MVVVVAIAAVELGHIQADGHGGQGEHTNGLIQNRAKTKTNLDVRSDCRQHSYRIGDNFVYLAGKYRSATLSLLDEPKWGKSRRLKTQARALSLGRQWAH